MANLAKNIVTLITLVLFMAGSAITIIGIFQTNDLSEKYVNDKYIIPSQVLNGLTIMFLLYLTATNTTFSASYKFLIILLLVGGMIIEIYLTSYADRKAESIAAYIFITLNFLIRAFFLIDLSQSEWVKPIIPIQKVVKETVMKPIENVVKEVVKPSAPTEPTQDSGKELITKWDKLKDMLKAKPEGLDETSQKDAWESVVKPARKDQRKDVVAVLKEAVAVMKDKDGNPIPASSVNSIGGRRS